MSSAEVTITGVLYDKVNRTTQNVVLIGEASLTNVGVGGGPVLPEPSPPGIWPSPGHPAHPIAPGGRPGRPGGPVDPGYGIPEGPHPEHPIAPGGRPPGSWGGPGSLPRPGRPVDPGWGVDEGQPGIPPKPEEPPEGGADKPPPDDGGWGFVSEWAKWGYFPAADEAQPK